MKDNLKRVKKDVNKMLIISIVASVLFVVGIPLIAMFAGKNWIVMTIGIVFVVFGFYGSPMLWLSYAGKRKTKRVVEVIVEENLMTNAEIAQQLSMNEKDVKNEIYKAVNKKYLLGYLYDGTKLTMNDKQRPVQKLHIKKCNNCGGKLEQVGESWHCPYCDMTFSKDEIK